ncbi:MAG: ABC transporter substrate-binding protein [Flavisolibacter sp.]
MPLFSDQTGRTVDIERSSRIVSIVPSLTELLFDLGLDKEVVGITKFCVHPDSWFRNKKRVGGTKQLHLDAIRALQPELIIANKEENVKEQVEELAKIFPVWTSDINDLQSALDAIRIIGEMTGKVNEASDLVKKITAAFKHIEEKFLHGSKNVIRSAYLIWQEPYMTAGGDTFINDMMQYAGFENVFKYKDRYPVVTIDEIISAGCEVLLLSSEPFPFKEKHKAALEEILSQTAVLLVDGEIFSWYGSRLLKAPSYFEQLQRQALSLIHAGTR